MEGDPKEEVVVEAVEAVEVVVVVEVVLRVEGIVPSQLGCLHFILL